MVRCCISISFSIMLVMFVVMVVISIVVVNEFVCCRVFVVI